VQTWAQGRSLRRKLSNRQRLQETVEEVLRSRLRRCDVGVGTFDVGAKTLIASQLYHKAIGLTRPLLGCSRCVAAGAKTCDYADAVGAPSAARSNPLSKIRSP
jgi:hypothetical protein